jgi:hypothetical protein
LSRGDSMHFAREAKQLATTISLHYLIVLPLSLKRLSHVFPPFSGLLTEQKDWTNSGLNRGLLPDLSCSMRRELSTTDISAQLCAFMLFSGLDQYVKLLLSAGVTRVAACAG